ncbi:MAG: MFS transporter, partial [Chloroflexi bacterium]|nr:MFS transporter [Chloroflexota bacterium]
SPWFALTLLLLVLTGATSIVYLTSSSAFLQFRTDPHFRGRVMGVFVLLKSGITPIGASITGTFAEIWGIRTVFALEGALCVVGALAGLLYFWANRERVAAPAGLAPG